MLPDLLLFQAQQQDDPEEYLTTLITAKMTAMLSPDNKGELTASSINGKSFTFQIPQGVSELEITQAAMIALRVIQDGGTSIPRISSIGRFL